MRKTSLLFASFFGFLLGVQAQENTSTRTNEHQIGINATNFIQTLVSFNGSTFNNTPYNFQYKYLRWNESGKHGVGVRSGFGYFHSFSHQNQPAQSSKSQSDLKMTDYRLGGEYQYALSKSWSFYAGVDIIYGKTSQLVESEFQGFPGMVTQKTDDYRERIGLGPVCGVQFNMGKRLALGTELSFYSITETRWRTTSFSQGTSNNQFMKIKSGGSNILVPSFIYFNLRL